LLLLLLFLLPQVNELAWTANSDYCLAATGVGGIGNVDLINLSLTTNASDDCAGNNEIKMEVDGGVPNPNPAPGAGAGAVPGSLPVSVGGVEVVQSIAAHVATCTNLRVDSSMRRVAVGGMDCMVSFWDLEDLVCRHTVALE
jgi:hypothetical protein